MRIALWAAVILLSGCASEKLQVAPPAGVDFSGHWKLNEADSDDPQRLVQAQFNASTADRNASGGADGSGGSGGSGSRGGRRGGGPGGGMGGPAGPAMPSVSSMGEGLRWPGKVLEVKQVAGVVAFISEGINRVCQPLDADKRMHHHGPSRDGGGRPQTRDTSPAGRDGPPPRCGWDEKALIVQGGDPDEERPPFEERYSLSEDGRRLVEVVGFKGGRSNGFTMSRVWDRVEP